MPTSEFSKTQRLREFALVYGVCERTAWRWHNAMGDAVFDLLEDERTCDSCHEPLPPEATIRRRYCDSYCRVNHHRRQQASRQFPQARP